MEARFEVAGEELFVAFEGAPGQHGIDELLDHDEAVAGEGVRLLVAQLERESIRVLQRSPPWCSTPSPAQT